MHTRNKAKQKQTINRQQASRRTTPIPEKLKIIIELANSIPPETELPDVQRIWDQMNQQALDEYQIWYESKRQEIEEHEHQLGSETDGPEYTAHLLEYTQKRIDFADDQIAQSNAIVDAIGRGIAAVNLCLDGLPESFQDYVWQAGEQQLEREYGLYEAMYRYTFARSSRERLRIIAGFSSQEAAQPRLHFHPALTGQAQIIVDEDGTLSVANDKFASAVDGVEARRIRLCEICKRIFWAGRINQPCCSTACAHSLRNRRYRARYKDYLVNQHLKENSPTSSGVKSIKIGKGRSRKNS